MQEGFFSEKAYDVNRHALATYERNLPQVSVHADLSMILPVHRGCQVLLAGPPCQGFSTSGKRRMNDPRNGLLMRIADVALANRSKVIVVENVPGAISGSHRKLWIALEDRLRFSGYNVRRLLIGGSQCGIAQRRERLFLLCWIGSDCITIDLANLGAIVLQQALARLPESAKAERIWPAINSKDAEIIKYIRPGQRLSNVRMSQSAVATWNIPKVFGGTSAKEKKILLAVARLRRRNRVRTYGDGDPVCISRIKDHVKEPLYRELLDLIGKGYLRVIDGKFDLVQTYNGRYRRLNWNEQSPTVDTRFGRVDLFVHPDEDRGMTPCEAARIQGFPDYYNFMGSRKEKFMQIGNAVPPPMASVVAKVVRDAILKA